jgi:aminopeptidase N
MTNSENIVGFGPNAYSKPATGLNMLRETIMGRKLFDYAFKEYARRWAFKHPTPADLFRTLEDASGEDLDWFWRGWFYGIEACDISLDSVKYAVPDMSAGPTQRDTTMMQRLQRPQVNSFEDVSKIRNREDKNVTFLTDADTSLRDFYWQYDRNMQPYDSARYPVNVQSGIEAMDDAGKQKYADKHLYELTFSNKGGLVMPIIIEWTYKDGTKEVDRIPAQVWRLNENKVVKVFVKDKEVASIKLDPMRETADIDESNNSWPTVNATPTKFQLFKMKQQNQRNPQQGINPMQKAAEKKKGF